MITAEADGLEVFTFSGTSIEVTARVVCSGCNTGWMSRLERKVIPILSPMIAGQRRVLSQRDQQRIAFWAAKTASIFTETVRTVEGVSEKHRQWIFQRRHPPPKTFCWIGHYREGTGQPRAAKVYTVPLLIQRPSQPQTVFKGLAWTAGIGQLAILTVLLPAEHWGLPLQIEGGSANHLLPIWPGPSSSATWPPPHALSDQDLLAVSRSFQNAPPGTISA